MAYIINKEREKTMRLTNRDIITFFSADFRGKRLPLKLSFALKFNNDALKGPITVYNEQRNELIRKYAEKNGDGEPVTKDNNYIIKDQAAWSKEMEELLDMEVEANIKTVDLETLEKCDLHEFDTLTVDQIETIYFMISE